MKGTEVGERTVSQLFYMAQVKANSMPIFIFPNRSRKEKSVLGQSVIADLFGM